VAKILPVMKNKLNTWERQAEWHGNPSLELDSYKKTFVNPHNGRKTAVFVWGKDMDCLFTVSAGASSEYSYTGGFYPVKLTLSEAMENVDKLAATNKLFK
jgi:hypothetical protein